MAKNVTVYVNDDVEERMKRYPETNWSEVARQAFVGYMDSRERAGSVSTSEQPTSESHAGFQTTKPFTISGETDKGAVDAEKLADIKAKFAAALLEAWGLGSRAHVW